jgi:hypothetical protein
MATFLVSGLVHCYIAYFTFGPQTLLPTGAFFVVHGLAVQGERTIPKQYPVLDNRIVKVHSAR